MHIFTTRHESVAIDLALRKMILNVPRLGFDEGVQLLSELVPNLAASCPDIIGDLVMRVDRLPLAIVLVGKMLLKEGDDLDAFQSVGNKLANAHRFYCERKPLENAECTHLSLGEIVEASYCALGAESSLNPISDASGDQLRRTIEALSILRPDPIRFNLDLAQLMVGNNWFSASQLTALADAGLLEIVRSDGKSRRYTMHRVIADCIRRKLSIDEQRKLNCLAAEYYLDKLTDLEDRYQKEVGSSYEFMYRYENLEWQDLKDNWLYHFSQTGYALESSISFLSTWFNGFWWWSCFTEDGYDFCDKLLNDWDYRLALGREGGAQSIGDEHQTEKLVKGLELLRKFKKSYPKETEDRYKGNWLGVIESLTMLRQSARLEGDFSTLSSTAAKHVRALTDIFLAEAERYGLRDCSAAEIFYREAVEIFRSVNDTWNLAWALYHLADLLGGGENFEIARPYALEAISFGMKGPDCEVLALAHKLLGRLALAGDQYDDSVLHYAHALEQAYRFQVDQEDPDLYTIQFYAKLSEAIANDLVQHHAVKPSEVEYLALSLRKIWLKCDADLFPLDRGAFVFDKGAQSHHLAGQISPSSLSVTDFSVLREEYAEKVKYCLSNFDACFMNIKS